jgi:hypothetical protein
MKRQHVLLLHAATRDNATFSYYHAWPRHFQAHPAFDCTVINVADQRWHQKLQGNALARLWRGDLVVILHSVFSNGCMLAGRLFDAVQKLPQPKAYFIGNEYKFMPEKMAFCTELGVSLLVSQSTSPAVHRLYRDRLGCHVTGIPNTGLDVALFSPAMPLAERPIDLGYRADDVPVYLGHNERRLLAEFFTAHAAEYGLRVDISLSPADRFREDEWAAFLNRCRGQLGSEAGGDHFTLDDDFRLKVNDFVKANPAATVNEIHAAFAAEREGGIPLRILSGRHVEAAGTGTVQILLEGHYDGYLHPDEHYIPLKKDFRNVSEAMRKFRDDGYCARLVANARDVALNELTYPKLIDRFRAAATDALGAAA